MFGTVAFAQSPFATTGSNIFQSVVGETAAASDSLASRPTYAAQFIDTVSSQDASSTQFVVYADVVEAVSGADTTFALHEINAFVFDAAFGLDVLTSVPTYSTRVSEATSIRDTDISSLPTYAARIAESTSSADSFIGQPLWVLIDDSQVPGWTDILIPTIIEDINVFGGANFGSLSFAGGSRQNYNPNPNPVVWNPIDDTQDAEWTNIEAV
jgi:hypothetical protein